MLDVKFDTSKKAMKSERRDLSLQILDALGSYTVNHGHVKIKSCKKSYMYLLCYKIFSYYL